MKKRFFAFFLLLAFLVLPAVSLASGSADTYIIDERGKLSATEIEQLNEKARLIEAEQGFTPMFAIVENAGGNVTSYLERLYTEHNGGENGLILGYSNVENKWSSAGFGLAADSFTEADLDQLWDAYNNTDTYIAGVNAYLDSASRLYAQRAGGTVPDDIANATEVPTSVPVTAEPVTEIPVTAAPIVSGNRVEDAADLLTPEQEEALAQKLAEYSRKHDCDIVVITTKSLGNKSARLFAADYYETCGYNMSTGGMVMMVCPEERDYAFVGTGKCYDITNDSKVTEHLKEVVVSNKLSNDDYNGAFNVFADKCDEFLTNVENGKQPYKKNLISTTFAAIGSAVVGLISGGSAAGGMASKLKSVRHKTGASDYVEQGSLRMVDRSEMFLYTNVIKTEKPRDNDRGSSGSSGGFSSSSGSSWSGSSGKY